MSSRRDFIKRIGGISLAAVAAPTLLNELLASGELQKITVLHTNDWHSRMDPFPMDGGRFQGLGGAAQRSALIKKIRAEDKNVLLLDAGDIFQGTPYFNFFEGELEYKVMSEIGYDLTTFGNHDFDLGVEGLERVWGYKNFDFVNCNYQMDDVFLGEQVPEYKIFKMGDVKVGITGVGIDLKELVPAKNQKGVVYNDPIDPLNKTASFLKNEAKCDMVICLSHLGYQYRGRKVSDIVIAENTENVDLIIGGHTHTFMDAPDMRINTAGKEVLIHQVGWGGINLGKIEVYFDAKRMKPNMTGISLPIGLLG